MWHESHGARVGGDAQEAVSSAGPAVSSARTGSPATASSDTLGERALVHVAGAEADQHERIGVL